MALRKKSFFTIPLLMESFIDIEKVRTIPHLIEVPNFKKFIKESIGEGNEALQGHTKV